MATGLDGLSFPPPSEAIASGMKMHAEQQAARQASNRDAAAQLGNLAITAYRNLVADQGQHTAQVRGVCVTADAMDKKSRPWGREALAIQTAVDAFDNVNGASDERWAARLTNAASRLCNPTASHEDRFGLAIKEALAEPALFLTVKE